MVGGIEDGGDMIGVGYCTCGFGAADGYTATAGTLCTAVCTSLPTLCTATTVSQVLTVA